MEKNPTLYLFLLFSTVKCWRIPEGQSKKNNPEKPATQGTEDEEKHKATCVGHHHTQTNTSKANKLVSDTTTPRHSSSYKQLEAKTKQTPFAYGNNNGHYNTELRTKRQIIGQYKKLNR